MKKEWSLVQYGIRIIFIGILSAIVAIICGKRELRSWDPETDLVMQLCWGWIWKRGITEKIIVFI